MKAILEDFIFCPTCLSTDTLGVIEVSDTEQTCTRCSTSFTKGATLISEYTLRAYVKQRAGKSDSLLLELDKLRATGPYYVCSMCGKKSNTPHRYKNKLAAVFGKIGFRSKADEKKYVCTSCKHNKDTTTG